MARKVVLIVDDTPDNVSILNAALMEAYDIKVATRGKKAIEIAMTTPIDIILLDVMMPGMDGPETLATLRANPATTGIPIIFMTAKVQPVEVAQLKSLGAAGVIAKPFDPMTLAAEVRTLLSGG